MPRAPRKPPSQTWRTFLTNHASTLASVDFFTVPTATFRVLYVFVVLAHDRRRVLYFNVTEHPTGGVIELPEVGGLHHRYERRAA